MLTGTNEITNTEDMIDSREILERIEYLADFEPEDLDDEERTELATLREFEDEARGYTSEFDDGACFIRDDYFTRYAEDYARDTCGVDVDSGHWPLYCIDWDQAARDLQQDYAPVEFDGVTYWVLSI